ncbi:hypothetical protein CC86DRAFT_405747 [Ophiobolus disseminans]|uniref:Integral membrane protein n=1 Tax=Ophiobolus disseminans TaxID=1469910 RepID=A0A6A7A3E5_9PLEO|nr:hypothetical protein CC86DRAFT_405747 [Ophiobolus disseminans]
MPNRIALTIAVAVLLLEFLPPVAAHGDDHMDMSAHDAPQPQPQNDGQPRSYWSLSENVALLYWHIGLEILAWMVILPVAVMLSIARSRFTLFSQLAFLVVNTFALLIGVVYSHKTPELYAHNSHSKTGWIITWIACAWVFLWVVQMYAQRSQAHLSEDGIAERMTVANMTRYQRVHDEVLDPSRYSNDSGQGTERNSSSLFGHSRSPSVESENQQFIGQNRQDMQDDDSPLDDVAEKRGFLRNTSVDRFFSRNVARFVVGRTLKTVRFFYVVFERTLLIQGLVAIANGTVVLGGIARGGAVFNVLAHFVKGSIFFLYGFLTLGRWMGTFADLGWAWNVKPPKEVVGRRRAAIPSAEFTESFFIWLYGATDIFLEHLAAWGDVWTAQDLEHAAIPVMFFGGGLLGMIIESKKMRELLNSAVVPLQADATVRDESWSEPRQYRFSMNPLPALMIMLLGKMMSSHHQDSMLSTMIHSQWGSMFVGAALMRGLTYIVLYISPPTSFLPSRPPTEIITSFCLISGGLTFMVSNKDTVAILEQYGLDAMFTFTLTMGITALLMAWATVVIAIKGWALRKESRSEYVKSHAGVLA